MPSLETAARSLKVEPIIALVHSDVEIEAAITALARRANTVRDLKPSQAPLPTLDSGLAFLQPCRGTPYPELAGPSGGRGRRKGPSKSLVKGFESMSRVPSLSSPFLLGFDEIERVLDRVTKGADGYPPYNIERIAAENGLPERLRITLAVAGFTRDQLDMTVEENQLHIRGRQHDDKPRQYLHRGIAARQFQRTFVLAEGMEVLGADLKNGLLSIDLARPQQERVVKMISIAEHD